MTNQSMTASQAVTMALGVVSSASTLLAFVVVAVVVSVKVAAIVTVIAAALFFSLRPLNLRGKRHAFQLSATQMAYASGVNEAVELAEETQAFGSEGAQRFRIAALTDPVRQRYFQTQFLGKLVPGIYQGVVLLLIVGALAVLYADGTGQVGVLGAIVLMLVRASSYGQSMQGNYHLLCQMLPFVERIGEAEKQYVEGRVERGDVRLSEIGSIEFENVSYSYTPEARALSGVSFRVDVGEAIGIVGPSGAGKSTLVQLLLRLRDPQSGQYLVNGDRADSFSSSDWHRQVAYVPQEPRLLHATVADNIRFFRDDLDDAAIERAAQWARIHDDVVTWSAGYGTVIGQRADAVSGGQRQRICLARALAASPQMLVLDEPTSALDLRSESLVQETLTSLHGQVTLFIVAHRLSMLTVCDRVMVFAHGELETFTNTTALEGENAFIRNSMALGRDNSIGTTMSTEGAVHGSRPDKPLAGTNSAPFDVA
jgi:ATP-binding cassette subfamily B protein